MARLTREQIFVNLQQVISEQLGVKDSEVGLETNPVDDLGADSLDEVEIVMAIEEHFGLELSDEEAESVSTVSEIVELLYNKHIDTDQVQVKYHRPAPLTVSAVSMAMGSGMKAPAPELPKLIPLESVVNTPYLENAVETFAAKYNENMENADKLSAATVRDLEGSDVFEIAMGGRVSPADIHAIRKMLEPTGFVFDRATEHLRSRTGEEGRVYSIESFISYGLPIVRK